MANAGLFGGQGPAAYINSLYAPQQTALANQQQARVHTLNSLVSSILQSLRQPQQDVYGAAAQDATSAANNAAQTLARVNPDAATQGMLRAIGAPDSQQQQVGNQNNVTFNGQGALGQYVNGALPAGVFAQDQAARQTYLNSLPAIVGQTALMGLGHLASMASTENAQLASSKAAALQKARTDLAGFVQKNQSLKMQAQKLADAEQNAAFNQNATIRRLNQEQQRLDLTAQMDAFNQKYKIANLNLASQKFAQMTLNQNRGYGLQLKRVGLEQRRMQLQAIRDEYKLHNNGFTPLQLNKFKTSAFNIAQNAFNGGGVNGPFYTAGPNKGKPLTAVDYKTAIREMRGAGVPLSIATAALKEAGYKPGVRGTPFDEASAPPIQGPGLGARSNNVVQAAAKMLGTPYQWGGTIPGKGLDCSGFLQQVYKQIGVSLPRTTYAQVKVGQPVSLNQLQPGDAVFTEPGKNGPNHVGMYIGNGMVQESPHTGDVNKVIPLQAFLSGGFVAARRYLGNG